MTQVALESEAAQYTRLGHHSYINMEWDKTNQ